jgi:hypothetical protein
MVDTGAGAGAAAGGGGGASGGGASFFEAQPATSRADMTAANFRPVDNFFMELELRTAPPRVRRGSPKGTSGARTNRINASGPKKTPKQGKNLG